MSRYATFGQNDAAPAIEGDARLVGVDAKRAPLLQAGWCADAQNLTFREGRAVTRKGLLTPASHRWSATKGAHVICGAGIFSDPNGVEWMLIATPHAVWALRSDSTPRRIDVPEEITGRVEIVQAFAGVLMFRGSANVPWKWDGAVGGSFVPISQADLGDGTKPIPNGADRIGLKPVLIPDRLYVPHGRSQIAASDLLDYERYDAAFRDYNLAGGNDDVLVALFPFGGSGLLAFNDGSIQVVTGLTGDLSNAAKDTVNRNLGCAAAGTVAQVGGDVFFLARSGVYRVQQVIESRLETAAVPVSDAIEPLLRHRVNWRAVQRSVGIVHGDYYFLAVPLDGAEAPNTLLPFNTVTSAWEGVHTFPEGVRFDSLLEADCFGRRALWGVDFAAGLVYRLYELTGVDRVSETAHAIPQALTTRGYLLGTNEQKRFHAAQITCETWNPRLTVSVGTDGTEETHEVVSGWTRSRSRRMVHGLPEIDPTNVDDDHATPRRQDYSVVTPFYTGSGIQLERMQAQPPLRWHLRERGRYAQLTISNTQGVLALTSAQLEGAATDHSTHPTP